MLLSEYTTLAARTAIYPRSVARYYTIENLVAEITEIVEAKWNDDELFSEAGDVLWQLAMTNREHNIGLEANLSHLPEGKVGMSRETYVDELVISGGYLLSRNAKRLRDGLDAVTDETMLKAASKVLEDLRLLVAAVLGKTLTEVGEANIAKLASRANRGVLMGDGNHR